MIWDLRVKRRLFLYVRMAVRGAYMKTYATHMHIHAACGVPLWFFFYRYRRLSPSGSVFIRQTVMLICVMDICNYKCTNKSRHHSSTVLHH